VLVFLARSVRSSRAVRFPVLALVWSLALSAPVHAHADDASQSELPPRRAVPDLDGRPPIGPDPVLDGLLWVPRILTSPLYVITENLIRAPLGALLTELERIGALDWLFSTGGPISVLPTMFYEFGLSPSVGIYAAWDGFIIDENRISLHAATWGEDWLRLIARDRVQISDEFQVAMRFEARRRPDQLVHGIGYDATQTQRGRFGVDLLEARVEAKYSPWRLSSALFQLGYRNVGFRDGAWNGEISVLRRDVPPPTGYLTGYELVFLRADLLLDTHEPVGELTRARFRARVLVEPNIAFGGLTDGGPVSTYMRWGGELAGSTDFLGRGRVFMLRFRTELVSPLQDGAPIPFYELPDAGGRGPLSGFISGQLRGHSTIGLSLEYVWPVYALLDGFTQITIGNAFGTHYEGFELDRLRLSWQIGIMPRFEGEHLIELSFGLGTQTFEEGGQVEQVRVVVGARHGL
jgi:hypothetical protein